MIRLKGTIKILFLTAAITSCTNTHDKLTEQINEKEKILFENQDGKINTKVARETIVLYRYFAEKFPDDSMSVEYLFKAGDVSSGINSFTNALDFFSIITQKYPQSEKAAYAMFLQGYINENNIRDTEKAKQFYTEFIAKYPTHEMAESAKFSLANLGKSPAEIIESFQQAGDSVAANAQK